MVHAQDAGERGDAVVPLPFSVRARSRSRL